jgi:hypothetical protein
MRIIKTAYSDHQNWAVEDKAEYRKLRDRKEILVKILGMAI